MFRYGASLKVFIICLTFWTWSESFCYAEDMSSSEYWAKVFGDPNSYVDIRLAARNSPRAAYTFASVADTTAFYNLAKQKELWVVVRILPSAGESFPQAIVARAERSLPDVEGRNGTILLTRGKWVRRSPYSDDVPQNI